MSTNSTQAGRNQAVHSGMGNKAKMMAINRVEKIAVQLDIAGIPN